MVSGLEGGVPTHGQGGASRSFIREGEAKIKLGETEAGTRSQSTPSTSGKSQANGLRVGVQQLLQEVGGADSRVTLLPHEPRPQQIRWWQAPVGTVLPRGLGTREAREGRGFCRQSLESPTRHRYGQCRLRFGTQRTMNR